MGGRRRSHCDCRWRVCRLCSRAAGSLGLHSIGDVSISLQQVLMLLSALILLMTSGGSNSSASNFFIIQDETVILSGPWRGSRHPLRWEE